MKPYHDELIIATKKSKYKQNDNNIIEENIIYETEYLLKQD